jgi:cyclopropane-fatty-acyl-phospholipid synthase
MDNFLDRYIFPGGYLPSVHRLLDAINVGSKGELEVQTVQSIGPHYVKTLRSWREKFLKNWKPIREEFESSRKGKMSEAEVEAWRRRCELQISFLAFLSCLMLLIQNRDLLLLILRGSLSSRRHW